MRAPSRILLCGLLALLAGCNREYVPEMHSQMLVAPMMYHDGRMSRPMACAPDRVYFAPGSAEISPETAACLRTKLTLVGITPSWFVLGFADPVEAKTEQERIELMRLRAANVVKFFTTHGLSTDAKNPAVVGEGGYVDRAPWMTVSDFLQEYRVVLVDW